EWSNRAIHEFEKNNNRLGELNARMLHATALQSIHRYDEAISEYESVQREAETVHPRLAISASFNKAIILKERGQNSEALGDFISVLSLLDTIDKRSSGDDSASGELHGFPRPVHDGYVREPVRTTMLRIHCYGELSSLMDYIGAYNEAVQYAERGLEYVRQGGTVLHRVMWLNNIAYMHNKAGRSEEALSVLDEALGLPAGDGVETMHPMLFHNRGVALLQQRNYDDALTEFRRAEHGYIATLNTLDLLENTRLIAQLHNERGEYATTAALLEPVIAEARANDTLQYAPELLSVYAVAVVRTTPEAYERCIALAEEAVAILDEQHRRPRKADVMKSIAEIHAHAGNTALAFQALAAYQDYYAEVNRTASAERAQVISALYSVEAARYKNTILEQQAALDKHHIDHLQTQLAMKANALLQQIQAVNVLKSDLLAVFQDLDRAEDILHTIRKKLNATPVLQQNWNELIEAFNQVNPHFLDNLRARYPDISKTESKVAVLILAGMENYQIAELLFVNIRAVEKHRLSIRKKLGIKRTDSIQTTLSELV
ncbi:MAG: helix-turn-helix transcriptional regulator, partial [Candidatus Kapabacteria bacterium]|nr:helix-turn-helix transcriptional regulator [Candidatus Kapabacteria bacterium]